MTVTVDSAFQADRLQVMRRAASPEFISSEDVGLHEKAGLKSSEVCPCYNGKACEVLLEDPALGLWAAEAASDYGVTAVDALELLAYALFLDGEK